MAFITALGSKLRLGHSLEHGQPIKGCIPEENRFFFSSSHQFPIASQLVVEVHELELWLA